MDVHSHHCIAVGLHREKTVTTVHQTVNCRFEKHPGIELHLGKLL